MQNLMLHTGWREAENQLLFTEVKKARGNGQPLKLVFERVAQATGRKPNSIRNYYYARVKADESLASLPCSTAFVPFSEEEIDMLLREVLIGLANGTSVRACTLALGKGDTKAMLRYQNKYRSLLKTDAPRVRRMLETLTQEGISVFDPYAHARITRAGRPRKQSGLVDVLCGVVRELDQVDGLDVTAFFESLGALAVSASRGAQAMRTLEEMRNGAPGADTAALQARISAQEKELSAQRERFNMLLKLYRQLVDVNRQFLGMTGVSKMSSLSGYIHDLSRNVEDCERLLTGLV
ncbi:MAG: hypothetical protein PHC80_00355 [Eubacteriales bacterium]|nr:hypothetical protein [Eubacteriales bacterium]